MGNIMTIRKILSAALLGGALVLTGASASLAATLRVAIQEDPDTLDPAKSGTYGGRQVFASLCDKLVDIDASLKIVPMLATSWEWNSDGTALTMHLRDGVKFHDGTPFDAAAVEFNITRAMTLPDTRRKSELATVKNVEVVDPLTVKFNLTKPDVTILASLTDRAGMMISPTAAKALGDGFSANPVCSGPFKFGARSQREFIRLSKFADYWDAANIHYDEVLYTYIEDATVRLARLQSGDIDIAERVAPSDLPAVNKNAALKTYRTGGLGTSFLSGGGRKTPFATDVKVRRAFELAIDRNVINQVTYAGQYVADNQLESPSSPFHIKENPMPARDPVAAKKLLAEAGYTDPVPVEITLANTLSDTRVGQIIQAMAGEAGFKVTVQPLESATATQRVFEGNFDVFLSNWSGRADAYVNANQILGCNRPAMKSYAAYCSKEADELMLQSQGESDTAKRYDLYRRIVGIYLDDAGIIALYHPAWIYAASAKIHGISIYPDGLLRPQGVKTAG